MASPCLESSATDGQDENLFQQLHAYPWDSDEEFQSGLHAILGPHPSPEQAEPLTLRARCFYYSRHVKEPFEEQTAWANVLPESTTCKLTSVPTKLGTSSKEILHVLLPIVILSQLSGPPEN